MKLKLATLLDPQFTASFNKLCQQSLSLVDSLRLARAGRDINRETETFNAARLAFFKANGAEHDGNWTLDPQKPGLLEAYNSQLTEVLAMPIELPIPVPIKLPPECRLTALDLLPILDLLDQEESRVNS